MLPGRLSEDLLLGVTPGSITHLARARPGREKLQGAFLRPLCLLLNSRPEAKRKEPDPGVAAAANAGAVFGRAWWGLLSALPGYLTWVCGPAAPREGPRGRSNPAVERYKETEAPY